MNSATPRILIVDDHPVNRRLASLVLRNSGITASEAQSGEEALGMLEAESFDCVLLDVNMPGLSGNEVCQQIRASEKLKHLRVVAYTAHAFEEERQRMLGAGYDEVVTKPVTRERLLAAILV